MITKNNWGETFVLCFPVSVFFHFVCLSTPCVIAIVLHQILHKTMHHVLYVQVTSDAFGRHNKRLLFKKQTASFYGLYNDYSMSPSWI